MVTGSLIIMGTVSVENLKLEFGVPGKSVVALDNVSYFYTRDVAESVKRLQTMIMPIVTMLLGAVLFWIIAAVLGPIYDVLTKINF